jgi:hypothetical protein
MSQSRVRMPMPSLAAVRSIEPAHWQLDLPLVTRSRRPARPRTRLCDRPGLVSRIFERLGLERHRRLRKQHTLGCLRYASCCSGTTKPFSWRRILKLYCEAAAKP